jgi:hypothetical protein
MSTSSGPIIVLEVTIAAMAAVMRTRVTVPGLLVADNVTSHASELADYLARVKSDPRLFSVILPIGNGEEISLELG